MSNTPIDRIIRHKVRVAIIEVKFVEGISILERDVIRECRNVKNTVNEGLSSIVGLWLSGPYIIKLFGNFITYMDSIVKKFNKTGFGGEKLGNKIIEFSEKYHHKVMWIFEKVAEKFTKDHQKQKTIAELLFTIVIGALLGHSIGDMVTNIATGSFDSEILTKAAKAAIKAKELYTGVTNAMKIYIPSIIAKSAA